MQTVMQFLMVLSVLVAVVYAMPCDKDAHCKVKEMYCGGCICEAYHVFDTEPACAPDAVIHNCFVAPCHMREVKCIDKACTTIVKSPHH
mmetsp:Transcript_23267/g.65332  ORF Transcript_23267/g.65332 Transcript_23267/m.65332 type:complete len:89 (-) Transcript_23267:136-402(-)